MTDIDDWDDDWDDDDDGQRAAEDGPDCGGCWDTGVAAVSIWRYRGPFDRSRPERARCATCNPSQRQRRRYRRRRYLDADRWARWIASGRITRATFDDTPF